MAVTRSTISERGHPSHRPLLKSPTRGSELVWLSAASLLIASGLFLVFKAKSHGFGEIERGLASKQLLNVNELTSRDDMLPFLMMFPDAAERQFVARRIYYASGNLPNAGSLARLRIGEPEIRRNRGLTTLKRRLDLLPTADGRERSLTLLTGEQFRTLLIIRLLQQTPMGCV